MAYGDYDGPNKPNKGKEGGACNRTRCQAEPALWYNHGMYEWYCEDCAFDIGQDHVNLRQWLRDWFPKCQHPQFETREQMDARQKLTSVDRPISAIAVLSLIHRAVEMSIHHRVTLMDRISSLETYDG